MTFKHATLAILFACAALAALPSRADTVQFVSTGPYSDGGEPVYPYYFSVNGSSDLIALECMDLSRGIGYGESWDATNIGMPMDDSADSQTFRADAWIMGQLGVAGVSGTNTDVDVQMAAWYLLDPSGADGLGMTDNATALANAAMAEANDPTLIDSDFFGQFQVLVPTDTNGADYTFGVPQRLLGYASDLSPSPEPSSLLLLGTGMLGLGGKLYRRRLG